MAQYREPLQPVDDFPVSFDDGEWTMGDLHHLKSVSTQLSAVLSEVCGSQAKDHASLLELQNQCVKGL